MKIDYDFLAQEYAQHRQVQPEVLKNLIQTGDIHSASQVLDVGCGTGNYTVAVEKPQVVRAGVLSLLNKCWQKPANVLKPPTSKWERQSSMITPLSSLTWCSP